MAESRSFRRAARRKANIEQEPITFDITTVKEDEDGNPVLDDEGNEIVLKKEVYHATPPNEDTLLASYVQAGRDGASTADKGAVIFDLFKASLPEDEYGRLIRRVRDPRDEVGTEMLMDIYDWLMEQWGSGDFPTGSQSVSSPQQRTTGLPSTGRAPGKGSSRSS